MKLRLSICVVFIYSCLCGFAAMAGPGISGGGDHQLTPSTEAEVEWAIKNVVRKFSDEPANIDLIFTDAEYVKDSDLKQVLQRIFMPNSADKTKTVFQVEFMQSRVIAQEDPCHDEAYNEVDSSTEFRSGADICVSKKRLTKIPLIALDNQIKALLVHEISHHLGVIDETMANRIQLYFSREYARLRPRHDLFQPTDWIVKQVLPPYANGQFVKDKVCKLPEFSSPKAPYYEIWNFVAPNLGEFFPSGALNEDPTITMPDKIQEVDDWSSNAFLPLYKESQKKHSDFCSGSLSKDQYAKYVREDLQPNFPKIVDSLKQIFKLNY